MKREIPNLPTLRAPVDPAIEGEEPEPGHGERPLALAFRPPVHRWDMERGAALRRRDVVTVPVLWLAAAFSLVFHVAMIWLWLTRAPEPVDVSAQGDTRPALVARLAPPATQLAAPAPVPVPPPVIPPLPRLRPSPPRTAMRAVPPRAAPAPSVPAPPVPQTPPPPVLSVPSATAPSVPPAVPSPDSEPPVRRPPPATDLATYMEMQRRAMADPTMTARDNRQSAAESDAQRRDRIVENNLAGAKAPVFGYDPRTGGGVFQMKQFSDSYAEFWFVGWSKDINRKAKQLIEVRKGNSADIRLAVVRRMIDIIRGEVQGDFSWRSQRLGHEVFMSARPADDKALEDFLLLEFFAGPSGPPR